MGRGGGGDLEQDTTQQDVSVALIIILAGRCNASHYYVILRHSFGD